VTKGFVTKMEEQISSNQPPIQQQELPFQAPLGQGQFPGITPVMLEQMKARAREEAIRMAMEQKAVPPSVPPQYAPQRPVQPAPAPNVVYVKRNLTVAEILLLLLVACGIVTGVQVAFSTLANVLPRIEVKVK